MKEVHLIAEEAVLEKVQQELADGGDPFGDRERIVPLDPWSVDFTPLDAPKVGDTMLFFPRSPPESLGIILRPGHSVQPCAALVVFVYGAKRVNLNVFDHNGKTHYFSGVAVAHPGNPIPEVESYCTKRSNP